jgi:hypothetical protein
MTQKYDLGTIFNTPEEYFRCVGSQILATKSGVVDFHHGRHGLAIDAQELVKNVTNPHSWVPSLDAGIVQHF